MIIRYNSSTYSIKDLSTLATDAPFFISGISFIDDWVGGKESFEFKSSGSTGQAKNIRITKSQIVASVRATANALKLNSADRALLCLSSEFIASKMMIARCLVLDLEMVLIEPCSNPFLNLSREEKIDFASFVPYQIQKILASDESLRLNEIKNILIGGGTISKEIERELSALSNSTFHTFGMTETVSHIALRKLSQNANESYFRCLDNVEINTNQEGCLIIKGPITNQKEIITNDIVEIIDKNSFKWLGRKDNLINSGGVKIIPEQIEEFLRPILYDHNIDNDFFIAGVPDENLGQKAIAIFEGQAIEPTTIEIIRKEISSYFSKYHVPKEVVSIESFIRTDSGKTKRRATLAKM